MVRYAFCPFPDSRVTRRVICGAGREGVITRDLRSHKICPRHPPRSATLKIHIPRWPLVPSSQVEKQTFMFERASIKGAQQRLSTQRNSLASGRRAALRSCGLHTGGPYVKVQQARAWLSKGLFSCCLGHLRAFFSGRVNYVIMRDSRVICGGGWRAGVK